jgi:insertion element IS1 protein InsB
VGKQAEPRWLWPAIDPHSGTVVAYVFGRRKDGVFLQRKALLEPFDITRFSPEGWGASERHIDPAPHAVGKEHTQRIERKHLNLRTRMKRLVRRTLCFANTTPIHDLVSGLFVNRYEFGLAL